MEKLAVTNAINYSHTIRNFCDLRNANSEMFDIYKDFEMIWNVLYTRHSSYQTTTASSRKST